MDQAVVLVHTDVDFHAEVPLVPLLGLVHLGISLSLLVLGGAGSCDQGGIDDRSLLHGHAVGLEVSLHCLKDLLPEIVPLQQVAESEDRGFIRDPLADLVDAGKPTHRRHLDQRILHRWIAEVVPLLQEMDAQHGFKGIRRTASFGASLGVTGLDQGNQRLPGHNSLHLSQKSLPLGALPGRALLIVTESELLAAHEPSHTLRSQGNCRADRPGFPESP